MAKKEQSVDMPHQVLDPRRDFYGYPAGLGQTYENFYGADAFHATVNIYFSKPCHMTHVGCKFPPTHFIHTWLYILKPPNPDHDSLKVPESGFIFSAYPEIPKLTVGIF